MISPPPFSHMDQTELYPPKDSGQKKIQRKVCIFWPTRNPFDLDFSEMIRHFRDFNGNLRATYVAITSMGRFNITAFAP